VQLAAISRLHKSLGLDIKRFAPEAKAGQVSVAVLRVEAGVADENPQGKARVVLQHQQPP
jgi:hypothetical protein